MSHDELRALVPAYAAGALDATSAAALRAHLATGCAECLSEVYRRPVGLPRAQVDEGPGPVPAPRRRVNPLVALLTAVGAGALALLAVRAVVDLRQRETKLREQSDRHALEAADERASLEARVRRLERELESARAEASSQADVARATRDESVRLEQALRAAEAQVEGLSAAGRPGPRGGPPPSPLAGSSSGAGWTAGLPARRIRLTAVAPFRDPRGQAVWRPGAASLQVLAFDLPPLPASAGYRLRVRLADGRLQSGPVLLRAPDGSAAALVAVPADAPPREIEVVLEPTARPVLTGLLDPAGG